MRRNRLIPFAALLAVAAVASCESSTAAPAQLLSDDAVNDVVATSSGDAIVLSLETMLGNASTTSLPSLVMADATDAGTVTFVRTRTCYDANDVVDADCAPVASIRRIVTHVTLDGSRSRTDTIGTRIRSFTGALHRVADDELTRQFNGTTETSRTHNGVATARDTTTFSEGGVSRTATESALDSVKAVKWNLPRASNPWPVSGSIVRRDSVKVTVTRDGTTETRDVVRVVTVTFPPDSQGNVVLTINALTCNLNLVTRKVTGCV